MKLGFKDEKGSSVQVRHGPATVKGKSTQFFATDRDDWEGMRLVMILKSGDLPVSTTLKTYGK